MHKYVIILLLTVSFPAFSQSKIPATVNVALHHEKIKLDTDTLHHNARIVINESSKNWFELFLPSIIALAVAGIALWGTRLSINRSEVLIRDQIEAAKKTAELEFRQNVLSKNRIEWIENLRNKVSEFCAIISILSFNFSSDQRRQELIERAHYLANYVNLMSNKNDTVLYEKMIDMIMVNNKSPDFVNNLMNKRNEIMRVAKEIIKSEWERAKRGE